MKPTKHVIFLGAGASLSSGYPLADRLTVLMCDPTTFQMELERVMLSEHSDRSQREVEREQVVAYFSELWKGGTDMLRAGDFRTMDEMSRFAFKGEHGSKVRTLKKAMQLVISLFNADRFHYWASDYRKFVQSLFTDGRLRDDVAVLSYNYDPYFEFRLYRAVHRRSQLRQYAPGQNGILAKAIHSGLSSPRDLDWFATSGFCHLKLHGAAVFPQTVDGDQKQLTAWTFYGDQSLRFCRLVPRLQSEDVPALLPWEILRDDGELLSKAEFTEATGSDWAHSELSNLFANIWQRARREVQQATKISFVGISMSDFLLPGLTYLFKDKTGDVELVIATKRSSASQGAGKEVPPVALRTMEVLTSQLGAQVVPAKIECRRWRFAPGKVCKG